MINIPKGTKDILPEESFKWHFIENTFREIANTFGFSEIRTPIFEHTELFLRGVGETTDIVNKEMYTFLDKGNRSITLKPEGTAGVARAFIENGLSYNPQPSKMYYITPVFRYEKPQAGRLREHHQLGVEIFGSEEAYADVEAILFADSFFKKLKINNLRLTLNNIGCPSCKENYNKVLKAFFKDNVSSLCEVCKSRLEKNPLRILDCKEDSCKTIIANAPICTDYLCDSCLDHKKLVEDMLTFLKISFTNNPYLVRGLDYYTGTVFEYVSNNIGAQGTVCGGGRYNNLVEEVGGNKTPAVGFGLGIERLLMLLEAVGIEIPRDDFPLIYVAPYSKEYYNASLALVHLLRANNIKSDIDILSRGLKAQLKFASKRGYLFLIVFGQDEAVSGQIKLKNMDNGEEFLLTIDELINKFRR